MLIRPIVCRWDSCVDASEACDITIGRITRVCQRKQSEAKSESYMGESCMGGWEFRWAPEVSRHPILTPEACDSDLR